MLHLPEVPLGQFVRESASSAPKGPRALVVESDPVVRAYLADVLEEAGLSADGVSVPGGLGEIVRGGYVGAIVGVDRPGCLLDPTVRILRQRGFPILFYTALGDESRITRRHPAIPVFHNDPADDARLLDVFLSLLDAPFSDADVRPPSSAG